MPALTTDACTVATTASGGDDGEMVIGRRDAFDVVEVHPRSPAPTDESSSSTSESWSSR
jgi:hypothetical protein